MIKVFLYLTNVVWRTNLRLPKYFYCIYIEINRWQRNLSKLHFYSAFKDTTHSSIRRNESGILYMHSARRCCFKTSCNCD